MKKPKSTILKKLLINFNNAKIEMQQTDESRRKFVGNVAKAGLLTTVLGSGIVSCKSDAKTDKKSNLADKKIVIIGAGIAGLNCAYQLQKLGVKSFIYEGSHRLGGRILTHYNDAMQMGIHPEFGGDFIDSGHQDMIDLATEFKLELVDLYAESKAANLVHETFFFDNRHLSDEEIISEFKKIVPKIQADIESLGEDYDTPEAIVLDKLPLSEYIASLNCKPWLKEIFTAAFLAEFGLDTSEQSTINLLDMIGIDTAEGFKIFGESDEKYRIKEGNSKLIEALANAITSPITKNAMLTGISKINDQYNLSFKGLDDVLADYVVITIPFTMLKDVKIDVKEMTPEKQQAINELGYGQNNKLFLGYKNRPWREGNNKFYGYLFHKNIHDGWDSSSIKSVASSKGVYCCFMGGAESIRLASVAINNPYAPPSHIWKTDLPEADLNKYLADMEQVFPGSKTAYNDKHAFACWSSYPFVKASYTCPKPGQWNTVMNHIMTPIGNIYFAGEHCSVDCQGFMNGGAETGRVVASTLIEKLKTENKK